MSAEFSLRTVASSSDNMCAKQLVLRGELPGIERDRIDDHRSSFPAASNTEAVYAGCCGFLKLLDAAYPAHTAIKLILDNHSSGQTMSAIV
jgi:hypothetical protein